MGHKLSTLPYKTKSTEFFRSEYGIKVLAEGNDPYFDIIALHGANGDREKSWTHEESNVLWLRDLLPKDVPRARILTYGYYKDGTYSYTMIHDAARIFIEDLDAYRLESETENRPIVFVAHDLGGIVLEFALVYLTSHYMRRQGSLPPFTFGVMFFGTPNCSTALSWLKESSLRPLNARALKHSEMISEIQSSYEHVSRNFPHAFFYETRGVVKTGGDADILVRKDFAIIHGHSNLTLYEIDADHYSMVKFGSHNDDNYISVCHILETMADQIVKSQIHIMPPLSSPSRIVDGKFEVGHATDQAALDVALLEKPFPKDSDQCLDGRITRQGKESVAGGGFSDISLGMLGDTQVAIKVLRRFTSEGLEIPRDKMSKRLWREYLAWSSHRHPNILNCLGFSYDFNPATEFEVPALISPWMKHGPLLSYLTRHPNTSRIPMIKALLSALVYLHNLDPPVVHGDIRAGNILVSDEGVPLLTDFGLSRLLGDVRGFTTSSNVVGTLQWMAPELLRNERHNEKSDVWAFGMTMLEILTGKPPYWGLNQIEVAESIRNGRMPTLPELPAWSSLIRDTCAQCWRMNPRDRPPLRQLYIACLL